jgi:valyl-tRNA synthetase
LLKERKANEHLIISTWPTAEAHDKNTLQLFDSFIQIVMAIRAIRNEKNISPKEPLELYIKTGNTSSFLSIEALIKKLCALSALQYSDKKIENAASFIVGNAEFYIPLPKSFDLHSEKEKIAKELEYNKGFLESVQKKLANERFVANAKAEVIELERKKQADAESKIKTLQEQLSSLH